MGLIRGVARTAVVAGTATAVSNRVSKSSRLRCVCSVQEVEEPQVEGQPRRKIPLIETCPQRQETLEGELTAHVQLLRQVLTAVSYPTKIHRQGQLSCVVSPPGPETDADVLLVPHGISETGETPLPSAICRASYADLPSLMILSTTNLRISAP